MRRRPVSRVAARPDALVARFAVVDSRGVREQSPRGVNQASLVRVGEPVGDLRKRHPFDLGDLDVGVGQFATNGPQQEVVDGLMHPPSLGDEPEVDRAESSQYLPRDPGLLSDLPDSRLLRRLAGLDVPLGQRPEQPTPAVGAPDECPPRNLVCEVDDEAARARLVDSLQTGAATRAAAGRARGVSPGRWRFPRL